jgi:hypothetical protein
LAGVAVQADADAGLRAVLARVVEANERWERLAEQLRAENEQLRAENAGLRAENERSGPLFKMTDDPRVTKVGRFLRSTSVDELPQLFNVLRGEMSLVGPRPALPKEVAEFPAELRNRESVPPGITGLWQVEARDNPAFEAYRRLDLFYVENWSSTLDLLIIIGTIEQLTLKVFSMIRPRRPVDTPSIPTLAQANAFTAETRSEAS